MAAGAEYVRPGMSDASNDLGTTDDIIRYEYQDERVGFWRSLWLLVKGARLKQSVAYAVTEDFDPEGGLREVWTRVKA